MIPDAPPLFADDIAGTIGHGKPTTIGKLLRPFIWSHNKWGLYCKYYPGYGTSKNKRSFGTATNLRICNSIWHSMTPAEKNTWKSRAVHRRLSPYNCFIQVNAAALAIGRPTKRTPH